MVEVPEQDPRGMGVAAILTSDLFRLRTTLDAETQERLDRQRILMQKDDRNDEEEAELEGLHKELDRLGFSRTIRDPLSCAVSPYAALRAPGIPRALRRGASHDLSSSTHARRHAGAGSR